MFKNEYPTITLTGINLFASRSVAYIRRKGEIWKDTPNAGKIRPTQDDIEGDDWKTERIGAYGEFSFAIFTTLSPDYRFYKNGDLYDFKLGETTIDIKTRTRPYTDLIEQGYYGNFFVKATNLKGELTDLKSDFYFFCTVVHVNHKSELEATKIDVKLDGWISKEDIMVNSMERLKPSFSKNSKYYNYYIKEEELKSPISFVKTFRENIPLSCEYIW